MVLKKNYVGEVTFSDGIISVTDPCYSKYVGCRRNGIHIHPGTYKCYAYKGVEDFWGERIWINQIVSTDPQYKKLLTAKRLNTKKSWTPVALLGVDAGLAGFLEDKVDLSNDETWRDVCDSMFNGTGSFQLTTAIDDAYILNDPRYGTGFFTESGCGDGEYETYAIVEQGVIIAMEIRF